MIARHRNHVEAAIAKDRSQMRFAPAMAAAGSNLKTAALGIGSFALAEPDVASAQRRCYELALSIHRFMYRPHVTATQYNDAVFAHFTLSLSLTLIGRVTQKAGG